MIILLSCTASYYFSIPYSYKNCTELWELFSSAFAYKEACDVTREDFMPYLTAAIEDTPVNKVCT